MGNCSSTPEVDKSGKERSDEIDKQLKEDAKTFSKECKILLLGAGEGGKSTIVKQMKIIHQNGFTHDELIKYRRVVYRNLIESAQDVVRALQRFDIQPVDPDNRAYLQPILDYRIPQECGPEFSLDPHIVIAIESIWKDAMIPRLMEHSSEFYLMDSAPYFFADVRRIGSPNYLPIDSDVLRTRQKSIGITDTRFTLGPLSIHMFDVGGQRSERKKWIHCFESVTSIIFCTALSEYDQVLLEESGQNRMQESLVLFDSVINSRWFLRTSVILFLNKIDVFRTKLAKCPLEQSFPEYTGGPDINKAAKFILWKFMQANKARLSVYPHLTQATDTGNIRLVFAAVKETILSNALKDSGIL